MINIIKLKSIHHTHLGLYFSYAGSNVALPRAYAGWVGLATAVPTIAAATEAVERKSLLVCECSASKSVEERPELATGGQDGAKDKATGIAAATMILLTAFIGQSLYCVYCTRSMGVFYRHIICLVASGT